MSRQPASVVIQRRVEWLDTDATGHYHHATVVRWVEAAECALLAQIGLTDSPIMPRVHYQASYGSRLWRHDLAATELRVEKVGHTSLHYSFSVHCGEERSADGRMVVVNVASEAGEPRPWNERERQLLLESGPLRPELLTVPSPRVPEPAELNGDPWGIGYG
jgi:acyl-CoA thioester hydrolase